MVRWRRLVETLVLALFAFACSGVLAVCPRRCDCQGNVVHCRHQRLQAFPEPAQLPVDTVVLDYGANNISTLDELPRLPNLHRLALDHCNIRIVGRYAFANVPLLENLTLSENNIEHLERASFQGVRKLKGLYLANNKLKFLPTAVFRGLALEELDLEGNAIAMLEEHVFSQSSVQRLNLKGNRLAWLTAGMFSNLQHSLQLLELDGNVRELTIDVNTFEGFNELKVLSMRSSHLVDVAFLKNILNLKTLYLSGNHFASLDLRPFHNLNSIRTLHLADMGLQSFSAEHVLSGLSRLWELDLSSNGIVMLLGTWFKYADNLTSLNLAGNRIFQLPDDLGLYLGNVESLNLAMNGLRSVRAASFEGMQRLQKLDLRTNRIQVFSEQLRPMFDTVSRLMLDGNPLHCNCEMAWYYKWLITSFHATAATRCISPTPTYIYNLRKEDFVCRPASIVHIKPVVYAYRDQDVLLQCVGEGDPAPVMAWLDPFGEKITVSPNVNRTHHRTHNTWLLSAVNADYTGNYTCSANNVMGETQAVTLLLASNDLPPSTVAKTSPTTLNLERTISSTSTKVPEMTASGADDTGTAMAVETTAAAVPINSHSSGRSSSRRTTAMTSTMRMHGTDIQHSVSQRTLAIVIGVVVTIIIVLFIIVIIVHRYRQSRYRRRYDVTKSIINHPDMHELDMSKDSKQIEV